MSEAIETPAATWDYAPAPESRDIVRLEDRYGLFVGGEFVEPKSGRWFTTIDPATEEPLAEVAEAGVEDVAHAVEAAREASTAWRRSPAANGRSTSTASPASSRSARESSPCSSR
jgi:aldehyde dehydrogenase (NAD+)